MFGYLKFIFDAFLKEGKEGKTFQYIFWMNRGEVNIDRKGGEKDSKTVRSH